MKNHDESNLTLPSARNFCPHLEKTFAKRVRIFHTDFKCLFFCVSWECYTTTVFWIFLVQRPKKRGAGCPQLSSFFSANNNSGFSFRFLNNFSFKNVATQGKSRLGTFPSTKCCHDVWQHWGGSQQSRQWNFFAFCKKARNPNEGLKENFEWEFC